ncbi:hypothetical protein D9M72_563560 [compost metagenome]
MDARLAEEATAGHFRKARTDSSDDREDEREGKERQEGREQYPGCTGDDAALLPCPSVPLPLDC